MWDMLKFLLFAGQEIIKIQQVHAVGEQHVALLRYVVIVWWVNIQ